MVGATAVLQRALEGDPAAVRAFVDEMTPIVQARVVRSLRRRRAVAAGRDTRQELADLVQEVFLALFDDDGRALRAFRPDRGLSLPNYVGLLAEREVASIMRSGRRSPWTEEPTDYDEIDDARGATIAVDAQVASRDLLERLLDALRIALTPKALHLFELLYMQERSVEEVQAETGLAADAIYAWRSRLGKVVRKLAAELEPPSQRPAKPAAEERAS